MKHTRMVRFDAREVQQELGGSVLPRSPTLNLASNSRCYLSEIDSIGDTLR